MMHDYNQEAVHGTWFPSGFHGHFRSKSRQEFTVPYRQRAKPHPPAKFLDRASVRSNDHLFSRHDNRNSHASTMGDLESYFSHGLGKRKSVTPASQHYKDTSSLLHWSTEPNPGLRSSYRSDFMNSSWPQQKLINDTEPLHSRTNLGLRRRQIRPKIGYSTERTAPLLAWNMPDESTHSKPCVGSTYRGGNTNTRLLSRGSTSSSTRTQTSSDANSDLAHVIETVSRLDL